MADSETKIEKIRKLCRKLKPIIGERADRIWWTYSAEDSEGKREIEELLQILAAKTLKEELDEEESLLVPPPAEKAWGSYYIGHVHYNGKDLYPFGLREDEWIQHVGIFGRSGAGKTNLGFSIVLELLKKKKPFLIFDWKRNYRDLLGLPEFKDVLIFTIGRDIAPLRFNPLIPPKGTDPKTWLKKLIEVIAHAYFLGNGVMYLLQKAIDALYKEFGVYRKKKTIYPTFEDVLKWVESYETRGRELNWLSSTLRAIATLCFGEMGNLLNTQDNRSLEELLRDKAVLELDALTQQDKVFFIETLLLWVHHFRLAEKKREEFKHAIVIEEAHHILSRERRSLVGGESIMEIIFREIREFGEAMLIIDQHPSLISHPALANTYLTVGMNAKHRKDVNVLANCMLLEDKEKEYLGSLDVGYAIVKLQGRIKEAFLIKIPEFEIKKGIVSDAQVRNRMAGILSGKDSAEFLHEVKKAATIPVDIKSLSQEEKALLKDAFKFPYCGTAERYRRLGLSARKGNEAKKSLLLKGLIIEKDIRTRKGRVKLIRPSEEGKSILEKDRTKSDGIP